MEKGRSKKASVDSSKATEKKSSSEITFDSFFVKCVREGKLQPWQRLEIEAFFKDHQLRAKEDSEIYEATLAKY